MTNPIHQHLDIAICADAKDAIARGFDYATREKEGEAIKPIRVKKVVVVRNGTQQGNSTVDFILEDGSGQTFVFMVTGNLLKTIPC